MTSHRVNVLMVAAWALLACSVDDRVLIPLGTNPRIACGASACGGAASQPSGLKAGQGGSASATLPGPCNDLNTNGILDKAETLAKNPTFDRDSDQWDPELGVGIVSDTVDACGSPASGSLNVTYQKSGTATGDASGAAVQCIAVTPGQTYEISARLLPRASGSEGGVGVEFFPTANCTGGRIGGDASPVVTVVSEWGTATIVATAPASAMSVSAKLIAGKSNWSVDDQADILADAVLVVSRP